MQVALNPLQVRAAVQVASDLLRDAAAGPYILALLFEGGVNPIDDPLLPLAVAWTRLHPGACLELERVVTVALSPPVRH